jgi:hypothetical protein
MYLGGRRKYAERFLFEFALRADKHEVLRLSLILVDIVFDTIIFKAQAVSELAITGSALLYQTS